MTSWSPKFGLPVPPLDAVAPTLFSTQTAVFYALATVVGVIFSIRHWTKTGRPVLLLIIVGGGLTVFVEPFVDLMGAAWHPQYGQTIVFMLFGRPIPWWMVTAYFAYFGVLGIANYLAFSKGISMRAMRLWFLLPMGVDVLIEEVMLHRDLYLYYGNQPLILLWKLPFWWVPCNSIGEFIGICLCVVLAPRLRRLQLLLIPLLIPLADMAGYALEAGPSWAVVNAQGASAWVIQLAGLCTYALAFLIVQGLSLALAADSPWRNPIRVQ